MERWTIIKNHVCSADFILTYNMSTPFIYTSIINTIT